jgi:hypothetical protein
MQSIIHYGLHFGLPLLVAGLFFRKTWKTTLAILIGTMLVDVDHLLANPIFQANRCSIDFHPLHSYEAILIYVLLLFFPKPLKIIGIGLLLHMATDLADCLMMYGQCRHCLLEAPAYELLDGLARFWGI